MSRPRKRKKPKKSKRISQKNKQTNKNSTTKPEINFDNCNSATPYFDKLYNRRTNTINGYIRQAQNINNVPFIPREIINIIKMFYDKIKLNIYYSKNIQYDHPHRSVGFPVEIFAKNLTSLNYFCLSKLSYFLLTKNSTYCYGDNSYGQLCVKSSDQMIEKFIELTKNEPFIDNPPQIISNGITASHVFFYNKTNKKLYGIGNNLNGQLGVNKSNHSYQLRPYVIELNFNLFDIQCGESHSLFLSTNGFVYGCGSNEKQQLGSYNMNFTRKEFDHKIKQINGLDKIKQIKCGNDSSYCLDINGFVYTFGDNTYGQLGVSRFKSDKYRKSVINQLKKIKCQKISAGAVHFCGLSLNDNCLITFGYNLKCQLGFQYSYWYQSFSDKPNVIKLKKNGGTIEDVKCGNCHNIVKTRTNNYYSFGYNGDNCACLVRSKKESVPHPQLISKKNMKEVLNMYQIVDIIPGNCISFVIGV